MSSSFRNSPLGGGANLALLVCTVLGAGVAGEARAAQYYYQPEVKVSAETDTNVQLDPTVGTDRTEGYFAEVSSVFGIATPRSETTVIPRLQYQNYPDVDDANRLQGDLNFFSTYKSERSVASILGGYEHLDELNAELSDARFNELNPGQQLSPETGQVRPGATRDSVFLNPTYLYRLTERTGLGGGLLYQGIDYDPDDATTFIDFDFYRGEVTLQRALSRRADLTFSPYLAKYEARDVDSTSDAVGGTVGLEMRWTQTFEGNFSVSYERDDLERTQVVKTRETVNAWGAAFGITRKGEISDLILSVGRAVTPSGGGSLYYSDQIQVQYDRDLSERMKFLSAARYIRDEAVSERFATSDRKYAQVDLGVEWAMSRTWFLSAGYTYISQEFDTDSDTAKNHRFNVGVGYRALAPQR